MQMHMERTCKCTCHTDWQCIVHQLQQYVMHRRFYPEMPLIGAMSTVITYRRVLDVLKVVCRELKLNPGDYGTHSFRAGGATELHCEGRDVKEIQLFGHWKSLDSAMGYIRPYNADLHKFIPDWDEYQLKRRKEGGYLLNNRIIVMKQFIRS